MSEKASRPSSSARTTPQSTQSGERTRIRTRSTSSKHPYMGHFIGIQPWSSLKSVIASIVGFKGHIETSPDHSTSSNNNDVNGGGATNIERSNDFELNSPFIDESRLSEIGQELDGQAAMVSNGTMTIQHGFQPIRSLVHSQASVISVLYVPNASIFVSRDSNHIHLWKGGVRINKISTAPEGERGKSKSKPKGSFAPQNRSGIIGITRWLYIDTYRLYVVASMRLELKILDLHFEEMLCIPSPAVLSMSFVPAKSELITGEVGAIRIRKIKKSSFMHKEIFSFEERLIIKDGLQDQWVTYVFYEQLLDRIFAACESDLYVYDQATGERIDSYYGIHDLGVTCVAFYEPCEYLITGGKDGTIKVWNARKYLMFDFHEHFNAITGMLLLEKVCDSYPGSYPLLLSSSLDGTLRMWNFETGQSLYRVDTQDPCLGIEMLKQNHFFHYTASTIQIWNLNRYSNTFAYFRSATTILRRIDHPSKPARILAAVKDGSIKLLSPLTGTVIATGFPIHKDTVTKDIAYNASHEQLYSFNSSGDVVVYNSGVNPFKVEEIWELSKIQTSENINCICGVNIFERRSFSSEETAIRLQAHSPGVPKFFLIAGNTAGQILDVQLHLEGRLELISQAHTAGITGITYDDRNGLLLTTAHDGLVKTWEVTVVDSRSNFSGKANRRTSSPFILSLSCIATISISSSDIKGLFCVNSDLRLISTCLNGALACTSYMHDGVLSLRSTDQESSDTFSALTSSNKLRLWASGSDDGSVKIWDTDGALIREIQFNQPITAITFANERGDLLVGLSDQISLVCVQDYLPQSILRAMLCMGDFEDDQLENAMAFDPELDFWEYLYDAESNVISPNEWHINREDIHDKTVIEDEVEKLLDMPEHRKNNAMLHRNRRKYLAIEHAGFIHSLKLERERARLHAENQDNINQIEEFVGATSSQMDLVDRPEPSTPTEYEIHTDVTKDIPQTFATQHTKENEESMKNEVLPNETYIPDEVVQTKRDPPLTTDESGIQIIVETNEVGQNHHHHSLGEKSKRHKKKNVKPIIWSQAAVLPNSTVMAEAAIFVSSRNKNALSSGLKRRASHILQLGQKNGASSLATRNIGAHRSDMNEKLIWFDDPTHENDMIAEDEDQRPYLSNDILDINGEETNQDDLAEVKNPGLLLQKSKQSTYVETHYQTDQREDSSEAQNTFSEFHSQDESGKNNEKNSANSKKGTKKSTRSRVPKKRNNNLARPTALIDNKDILKEEVYESNTQIQPTINNSHLVPTNEDEIQHRIIFPRETKLPTKHGMKSNDKQPSMSSNNNSSQKPSKNKMHLYRATTRAPVEMPFNEKSKQPTQVSTEHDLLSSDTSMNNNLQSNEEVHRIIHSKVEEKEIEDASHFIWNLVRQMKLKTSSTAEDNSANNEERSERAENISTGPPIRLDDLAVVLNQSLKDGTVSEIQQASQALLFLYKSFGSDVQNVQEMFVQGHVDQLNHASPEVRAAMCTNAVKFRLANENLLLGLIFSLDDSSPLVVKAAMEALAQLGITNKEALKSTMIAMKLIPGYAHHRNDEYLETMQLELKRHAQIHATSNLEHVNRWLHKKNFENAPLSRAASYMDHLAGRFYPPDAHDEAALQRSRAMHTWEALLGATETNFDGKCQIQKPISEKLAPIRGRALGRNKFATWPDMDILNTVRKATAAELALKGVRAVTAGRFACYRNSNCGRPLTQASIKEKPKTAFSILCARPKTTVMRNNGEKRDFFPAL